MKPSNSNAPSGSLVQIPCQQFLHTIEQAIDVAADIPVALVFIDLDRHEFIKQQLGHSRAYQLLSRVAERLQIMLGEDSNLSYLGSDEFALLVPITGDSQSKTAIDQLVQPILQAFEPPFWSGDQELQMTASIGVSVYPDTADTPETLFHQADQAMYQTRLSGVSGYTLFNPDKMPKCDDLALEMELRKALKNHKLQVYYQPKVGLQDQRQCQVEALARWQHPQWGWISPARFIAIAERSSLINCLGEYVLTRACLTGRQWLDEGLELERMSVNLSASHLLRGDILAALERVFQLTHFPADKLEIEITESVLLDANPEILLTLEKIRAQGIGLAIDDFGTGYSSLKMLKTLPVDLVKIDQSFIADLFKSPGDTTITQSIIQIAHDLGIKVIAEGIEHREQVDWLKLNGCDSVQGFYISEALSAKEMASWLSDWQRQNVAGEPVTDP